MKRIIESRILVGLAVAASFIAYKSIPVLTVFAGDEGIAVIDLDSENTSGAAEAEVLKEAHQEANTTEESDYFIGVSAGEIEPILAKHLKLKSGQGLAIQSVIEGSPADKAGLEEGDILLTANSRKLSTVDDLLSVIQDGKGEVISLKLIHNGEKKHLTVTPQKRPKGQARAWPLRLDNGTPSAHDLALKLQALNEHAVTLNKMRELFERELEFSSEDEQKAMQEAIETYQRALAQARANGGASARAHASGKANAKGKAQGNARVRGRAGKGGQAFFGEKFPAQLKLRTIGPMFSLGSGMTNVPNGVSISVSKENDEPASIRIQRGKDVWEFKENDKKAIEKLPKDIRKYLDSMNVNGDEVDAKLQKLRVRLLPPAIPTPPNSPEIFAPRLPAIPPMPSLEEESDDLMKQMEAMQKQLQKIQEELEKLHEHSEDE